MCCTVNIVHDMMQKVLVLFCFSEEYFSLFHLSRQFNLLCACTHILSRACIIFFKLARLKGLVLICQFQPPYLKETHPVLFPSFNVWLLSTFCLLLFTLQCLQVVVLHILFIGYSCFLQDLCDRAIRPRQKENFSIICF